MLIHFAEDVTNPNNVRLYTNRHGQLCKVYGFTPEEAREKASMIAQGIVDRPAVAETDIEYLRKFLQDRREVEVMPSYKLINDALERVLDHFS